MGKEGEGVTIEGIACCDNRSKEQSAERTVHSKHRWPALVRVRQHNHIQFSLLKSIGGKEWS